MSIEQMKKEGTGLSKLLKRLRRLNYIPNGQVVLNRSERKMRRNHGHE